MRLRVAFVAVLVAVADDVGPINVLSTEVGHPSPTYIPVADVDPAVQTKLNEIPTRLRLPIDQVDLAIEAGRKAIEVNPDIKAAVAAIHARAGVRPAAIMTAAAN
ncbi:hypothetical protein [Mesorhizobium sp. CA12]|uniref:hypothetical protein n=1 Tax=Mesorhizobium sp. CA12 TaxID=2876644 RepID=UPI001CCD7BE0|nr:hypothetical protein [Mesorhizobium sp. CA12]MBZ9859948.1 hypothetical protein [Mesorhizobium sp. CA12]